MKFTYMYEDVLLWMSPPFNDPKADVLFNLLIIMICLETF